MQTKFAIGCLVQWYEVYIISEYVETLKEAISQYDGEVIVDFRVVTNEDLEKCISTEQKEKCINNIKSTLEDFNVVFEDRLYSIADYRREFNDRYCDEVDVLVWGESDMLVPKQTFITLDQLHQNVKTPKYVATFGICKMWDASWKVLEHPKFTDKPFIENDYNNWWSLKYTMSAQEMNSINNETEDLEVLATTQHKFNGCGLVISSEVIKAGVNIPSSVFFVHEDTAFMIIMNKLLGSIPQYIIKNILVVHNRNHPKKRMYIKGESGETMNQKRRSNDWYIKANKYSEENCYNLFNPNYKSKTWKDIWK